MTAPTVLIVDDDEGITETFSRMLMLEGYAVHTAGSAEAGLDVAASSPPDAILLDLRMPVADGMTFLRRLRQDDRLRNTPVAIVTGDYFLDESTSSELGTLGATVYFKPLWLEDLVRITRTLVSVTN
jgi:CheY-like chemotaxis protein